MCCFEAPQSPEAVYEVPQRFQKLVREIKSRGWNSVWVADDSALFMGWYKLLTGCSGMKFANLFNKNGVLTDMGFAGQQQYLEQLAKKLLQRISPAEFEQLLDKNATPRKGLREFIAALPADQGLVVIADNFRPFVERILSHHGLDLPLIANELNVDDGTVQIVSETDGFAKEEVCKALLQAPEGIWVNGIACTIRTMRGSIVRFASNMEVPLICLTKLALKHQRAANCQQFGDDPRWEYLKHVQVEHSWAALIKLVTTIEQAS